MTTSVYTLLRDKGAELTEGARSFAQALVRTPSPGFGEEAVACLVESKMRDLGYDKVFRDDYGNVVGIIHGKNDQPSQCFF